jgi:hypothetical protein
MDHITTSRQISRIYRLLAKSGDQKDKNINDNETVKFNSG